MNLSVEIIDTKTLSDGHLSFLARCNGDPVSDSWHTCAIDPGLSPAGLDAFIAAEVATHQQRVAEQHAARTAALGKLATLKGKTKTISL